MIHSLAGGKLTINNNYDYAKVEILEGEKEGSILWFLSPFEELKAGDIVLVPIGKFETETKGKVIRVDKNVNELSFPVPIKRMKIIIKILP